MPPVKTGINPKNFFPPNLVDVRGPFEDYILCTRCGGKLSKDDMFASPTTTFNFIEDHTYCRLELRSNPEVGHQYPWEE